MNTKYYDKTKIGKLISAGSEHIVFNYDNNKVIKFSIIDFLLGRNKGLKRANSELSVCKQYFGGYILETQIVTSVNLRYIAQIQPKVTKRYLKIDDMTNPSIRKQFIEIIQNYERLIADGNPEIDLTGQAGLFKQRFSNIFIVDNQLTIIDTTLLKTNSAIWAKLLLIILRSIVLPVQNRRINRIIAS